MNKMNERKVPMYTGYRKCMVCGLETTNMSENECPECGRFLYPIGQAWLPKIKNETARG